MSAEPLPTSDGARRAALLASIQRPFLVGIGGVGMRGAAQLLAARGLPIAGSDRAPDAAASALHAIDEATVLHDDGALALPEGTDLLVYSAAVPASHPLRRDAHARGIPTWSYATLLGALMAPRRAICVAGCHGKTTTSSLLSSALVHAGADPSYLIGGTLHEYGSGARAGDGPHFVAESCEFDRSFHRHEPTIAIVTNVDEDHLDYYADLAEIQESFREFAARLPHHGVLLVNDAHAPVFEGDVRLRAALETYGFGDDATWRISDPTLRDDGGGIAFHVEREGAPVGMLSMPLYGHHNALNAVAAFAAMVHAGIDADVARTALGAFQGVGRRLELIADRRDVRIYDDYGHHPTEIRATLRALRPRHPARRVIVVFQPHQASRTRCLLDGFAAALAEADQVWMPPIHFARDSEEARRAVTSEDLARHVRNEGGHAIALPDLDAVVEHALEHARAGDVIVTMGAGNIDEVARALAERL